jgi:HPt (histidine-containing phosphotransfer) domain-containing protein
MTESIILDRDHLDRMTGSDRALQAEILSLFRHQAELWGRLLDPKAPSDGWVDAAHTLKGSARSIGAVTLAKACQDVETAGRDGSLSQLDICVKLSAVRDALDAAIIEIARLDHELSLARLRSASQA